MNELKVINIEYLQTIIPTRKNCLWYGGNIIRFDLNNGGYLMVGAYGDIELTFTDKKTNDVVKYYKDKNNSGCLYCELEDFIDTDEKLSKILNDNDDNYECYIGNNNWFEVNYIDKDGNYSDWCFNNILDTDMIDEIEKEIMDSTDYWFDMIKEGD